jgi:hypothetical protein
MVLVTPSRGLELELEVVAWVSAVELMSEVGLGLEVLVGWELSLLTPAVEVESTVDDQSRRTIH